MKPNTKLFFVLLAAALLLSFTAAAASATAPAGPSDPPPGVDVYYAISEEVFPDENFREYVKQQFDANNDGFLNKAEREAVTKIDTWSDLVDVYDYTGIALFPNLTTLICKPASAAIILDTSGNPALEKLNCRGRTSKPLDFRNNPALKELDLATYAFSSLDFSHNPALTFLQVSESGLQTLDVSGNPALKTLYCFKNSFTTLDVSGNPALELLHCSSNSLTTLDLSSNPALTDLDCGINSLTTLDLSGNPALKSLNCKNNPLCSLDLSGARALSKLDFTFCTSIDTLDVSACSLLVDAVSNGRLSEERPGIFSLSTKDAEIRYTQELTFITDSHIISFDINGGEGFVKNQLVRLGEALTLPECGVTPPEGKQFAGWQVGDTVYQPGSRIEPTENVVFTAMWEDAAAPADGLCQWCGKLHNGFFGKIVWFFHLIFYFIARLFG